MMNVKSPTNATVYNRKITGRGRLFKLIAAFFNYGTFRCFSVKILSHFNPRQAFNRWEAFLHPPLNMWMLEAFTDRHFRYLFFTQGILYEEGVIAKAVASDQAIAPRLCQFCKCGQGCAAKVRRSVGCWVLIGIKIVAIGNG